MELRELPALSHFQNDNVWSASVGRLKYWMTPHVKRDELGEPLLEGSTLDVEVWQGPWAKEFSTIEAVETFPLTPEGLEQVLPWLREWLYKIESRRVMTFEEELSLRKEPKKEEEKDA